MTRRLHVVHIVCTDAFAGVERYVVTTSRVLAARGVDVTVIGGDGVAMQSALVGTSVTWRPGSTMATAFRHLMATRCPDLVNAHMTQAELVSTAAGLLRRVPVVSTRHFGRLRGSSTVARVVGDRIERRIARQISISAFVASRVGSESVVVHSGVDDVDVEPDAARENAVLVAQRLEAEKNTSLALHAWAGSVGPAAGWRLWIAGSGSELDCLRALAKDLGIADSVDFLGHRSDVIDLFRRASVFLAPTPLEGFGLSVAEAMAAALPVVATAAGGHLETAGSVPGSTLFAPGDGVEAAKSLDALITDPRHRTTYGAALQQRQRSTFTLDRQVDETMAVYRDVIG